MKKNILTIIIMAIVLINTVLTGLLIFTIVPTANKTNQLVSKVASIVDLELESPSSEDVASIEDIVPYDITDKMTINLKSTDATEHYMTVNVSLQLNKKNKDLTALQDAIKLNENSVKEVISDEFSKYTKEEVQANKDKIKDSIVVLIKELLKSDIVVGITFANMLFD